MSSSPLSSHAVADWVCGYVSGEDHGDEVRTAAAERVLDTLGCLGAGSRTSLARTTVEALAALLGRVEESPGSTVWALAATASACDFDDGHYLGGGIHAGAAVVPAALVALSRADDSAGARFLPAVVAGYEVAIRVGRSLVLTHPGTNDHCSGTADAVGAAVAVGAVEGATVPQMEAIIKMAWSHAPMAGLQFPYVKEAIGWAGYTGFVSARLAGLGVGVGRGLGDDQTSSYPPTPFDDDRSRHDPVVASFGVVHEIRRVYSKSFACCRFIHPTLHALAQWLAETGRTADDIESIEVATHRWASFMSEPHPWSLETAQYSFPFVIAAFLTHGSADPDVVNDDRLDDPAIAGLAARIRVRHDPACDDQFPARYVSVLRIVTRDGVGHRVDATDAPGDPALPHPPGFARAKYDRYAAPLLGSELSRSVLDLVAGAAADPPGLAGQAVVALLSGLQGAEGVRTRS